MTRKICVITGTRAEYGLLKWLLQGLKEEPVFTLQIVVTGMHLSPEFGLTYREIEEDGFLIDHKVEMILSSDTAVGIGKSTGLGIIGFVDAFRDLEPDLILVLGDRFEILSATVAALFMRIPVAHLHGGELTQGALDDALRHAITKLSHIHFVATEEYRRRVIQLGEAPNFVHRVGGLGVEAIKRLQLLSRPELEQALAFRLKQKNLLITFHPATSSDSSARAQFSELLVALDDLDDTGLIFTLPNADEGGRGLIDMVSKFVDSHTNACAHVSLGQLRYLSCMSHCDGVIGNSSSGLLEAPSMKKGTVNIGTRQHGRSMADSVINCNADSAEIKAALQKLYSPQFQARLAYVRNPYDDGRATERILRVLRDVRLDALLKKSFYDLPGHCFEGNL
jgi:GDP/UDP-N,N'-diacetylbacillosamine 2-epimerase (hydrolysing)